MPKTKMCTILDLLRWGSSRFNAAQLTYGHGTDNFWDEALHLILPSLYLPLNIPTKIYHAKLSMKERSLIMKLINLRIQKHIPVPYLTNKAWFCGLEFYVDNRVFIPRSPIGELILSNFHNLLSTPPKYVLDLCTGSGCIAIAIATIYPKSKIDASDISIHALKVAEHNIQLHNLAHQILPIHSDLFNNIPLIKYDLIITNPPYVSNIVMRKLPKEFLHEPTLALSANSNGLEIIHRILINITNYLNTNGILICETGISKNSVIQYYPNTPFHWFNFNHKDGGVFALTYKQLLSFRNKNYIIKE
ncbi:predicted rRNA or tRNA methylase [Candidatus Blochmanniella floridana]|uniref:Predicted rRNA or tRNA methylase n=1 Tax=Blochmanniella floridana TaxID=203907 RepID=Q7VRU7_BLOFL|nr:predicted rRNA or tRNA methylase [Candidatus Blochmannia floridanus]